MSSGSRGEPEDDGGEDHHRPIIDRALLIARRQPAPLLEAIDTALHDVAASVDRLVERQRTTGPRETFPVLPLTSYDDWLAARAKWG